METTERTQKKAEIVIEQEIIKGVYSFPELMYRNKNRFEMILSQPNEKIHFEKVKAVFKGRFICKNDNCLQDKRFSYRNQRMDDSDGQYNDVDQEWINWWKKQDTIIRPQVKEEGEIPSNHLEDAVKVQRSAKKESKVRTNTKNKKTYVAKVKEQAKEQQIPKEKEKEKENTRWSSSLTYVIMRYYTLPESLDKLKKVYNRKTNNKCEIYFYIELMGQKCRTCKSQGYCYPFFGKTELKRMRKNFSSYIFNKIQGKPILRYKPCRLRRLQGHEKKHCQACQLGECGFRGDIGNEYN